MKKANNKINNNNFKNNRNQKKDNEPYNPFKYAWESDASLERKKKRMTPDEVTYSKSLDDDNYQPGKRQFKPSKSRSTRDTENRAHTNRRDFNDKMKSNQQKDNGKYGKMNRSNRKDEHQKLNDASDKDFRKSKHQRDNKDFQDRFVPFSKDQRVYKAERADRKGNFRKFEGRDKHLEKQLEQDVNPDAKMPLNKYLAHCGICSRRDAVEIVKSGKVKVNNEIELSPAYKVQEGDVIQYNNKKIVPNKNLVYYLLNKPKGYITTTDDPKGRRTVLDIFKDVTDLRIYPVGRLDRNTTGLLLLTNDGDLAQKLSHPKYKIKKIYQVLLDKPLLQEDFQKIVDGLTLEDGLIIVDKIAYLENNCEIGIEIHSGKNRIVRRIFEHLGYQVEKLDRVMYAGLTKKNIPKGHWRNLTRQEVVNLKHFDKQNSTK